MILAHFVVLIMIIMVQSCEKNNVSGPGDNQNYSQISTKDGILVFDSGEQLFSTLDKLNNYSPEDYIDWCISLGFNSYGLNYSILIDQFDEANSTEEILQLVYSNPDLVKINDENEITTLYDFGAYSNLVSRDGYFYVNDVLTKVTNDNLYFTKNSKEAIQRSSGTISIFHRFSPYFSIS